MESPRQRGQSRACPDYAIANIFTGSKTKRLEAEIVRKDNEIREMKDRAEARERDLHREIFNLSDILRRQKEHEADTVRSYEWKIGNFVKFFPDAVAMLPAIEDTLLPVQAERGGRFGGKGANQARPGGQQIPSPCQCYPDIPMAQRPMATADTDG